MAFLVGRNHGRPCFKDFLEWEWDFDISAIYNEYFKLQLEQVEKVNRKAIVPKAAEDVLLDFLPIHIEKEKGYLAESHNYFDKVKDDHEV
ncbi:MAG TPA: hypothetical protein PL123_06895 [Bacteroidales bacterium]|nr:hypothetical protein [Bacteroidales bacterium]